MSSVPGFPGGVSVSRLKVYDWPTGDAPLGSGTPHLHTVAAEGYVVIGGHGAVQTLCAQGAREEELFAGAVVWFTPGVIHRLINRGDLEIMVVMSDAGIPERGDAVFPFPEAILRDEEQYWRHAAIPQDVTPAEVEQAVQARRDLALEGFRALWDAVNHHGSTALEPLYAAATHLLGPRAADWATVGAAESAAQRSQVALTGVGEGDPAHLFAGALARVDQDPGPARYGMCGRLTTFRGG